MALSIDKDLCIGCGVCAAMVETVFEMDEDNGIAIITNPEGASKEEIEECADACPVNAITV